MSVSAYIDLRIKPAKSNENSIILTSISLLLNYGWTFNDGGYAFYLPIDDDGDFDWQRTKMSDEMLISILRQKEKLGELVGVAMTWENTEIGGTFLLYTDGRISVSLLTNRRQTETGTTDVNWYLDKLIPAFKKGLLTVESINFSEHI